MALAQAVAGVTAWEGLGLLSGSSINDITTALTLFCSLQLRKLRLNSERLSAVTSISSVSERASPISPKIHKRAPREMRWRVASASLWSMRQTLAFSMTVQRTIAGRPLRTTTWQEHREENRDSCLLTMAWGTSRSSVGSNQNFNFPMR